MCWNSIVKTILRQTIFLCDMSVRNTWLYVMNLISSSIMYLQFIADYIAQKCWVTQNWHRRLWTHKKICKPFACQLMDSSQSLRDKIEFIWFPIKSTCNQSKKWNGKEAKRLNLNCRFIPNPKLQNLYKKIEAPWFI